MIESIVYYSIRIFGFFIRALPLAGALAVGRGLGTIAYHVDSRHRSQAYANIKRAFGDIKSPREIQKIVKELFHHYGQNVIELLRMPLLNPKTSQLVEIGGKENVDEVLKQGKGVILLAMHFGSWEMANFACAMFEHPYNVMVKPQTQYARIDDLLNSYRSCSGTVVVSRGIGTRDILKSLKNNEIIGMVMDQGGKDGVLVPFFGRLASMSAGAIRIALKLGTPICFAIIIRQKKGKHRMIIHQSLELQKTEDLEKDIVTNVKKIVPLMENYIRQYPSEYVWFYKIWKYSKESMITILSDGKVGHLRQSERLAQMIQKALVEREIQSSIETIPIIFKSRFLSQVFSLLSVLFHPRWTQGRLDFLKYFLTPESFHRLRAVQTDFIVSCGSSIASVNQFLSHDHKAKSIVILRPGLLSSKRFDLSVLPQHDVPDRGGGVYRNRNAWLAVTHVAPNLITPEYLKEKEAQLLNRFSHLRGKVRFKIGLFVGGNSDNLYLSEHQIKILIRQIKSLLEEIKADILITTSRRTPQRIEQILFKEFKKDPRCPLLILANRDNVEEAIGGILSLSDIVVVSGDSISMVSEAVSSGKKTVVFLPKRREIVLKTSQKHLRFVENLKKEGFVLTSDVKDIGQSIYEMMKNKIQARPIHDDQILFEAARHII